MVFSGLFKAYAGVYVRLRKLSASAMWRVSIGVSFMTFDSCVEFSTASRSAIVRATLMILKYERAERLSFSDASASNFSAAGVSLMSLVTWYDDKELLKNPGFL